MSNALFRADVWRLLVTAGLCLGVAACDDAATAGQSPGAATAAASAPGPAASAARPVLAVSLVSPQQQPWSERITASGNIQPWQLVSIGSEVTGLRLVEVLVTAGDTVRKGQLLARLDDASLKVELNLQRAALAEAEANRVQSDLSLERARKLDASRAISLQDLLQYETAAATGGAKVAMARAQIEALELRLHRTRIVAPDDGVIAHVTATVGALADGTSDLFKLIRKGRIEWRAELRPEQQAKLQIGQEAELRDPLGQVVIGRVRQLAPIADPESRHSLVYVDVQPTRVLKPGVLVSGEFVVANRPALTVPSTALVQRDGFSYAITVDARGVARPAKLRLGSRRDNQVEVLAGLTAEDRIVATGGAFLNEGDRVTVVAATAAAPGSVAMNGAGTAAAGAKAVAARKQP
jgi:RND family efflux transporter MFP subunit